MKNRGCFVCAATGDREVIDGMIFCKSHAKVVRSELNDGAEGATVIAMRLRGDAGKDVILRDVPEAIHRLAKQEALNTGETMREVIVRCIKQQLAK